MRFSWKAIVGGVTAAALFASSTTLGLPSASAQPTPPTRFFGTVTLSGGTAPAGATVQAMVGSTACGTGSVTGGSYVVDVNSASTTPGCARDGDTVSFSVNGTPARETGRFQTGAFVSLNLTAQAATATPAPTGSPTPVRTATPAPTASPTPVRTATPAPTASPVRTATPTPAVTQVRTPTPIAATPRPQGAVGAPQAQRPGGAAPAAAGTGGGAAAPAAAARPAATGGGAQAAALPRTGAAVTADSSTSTGWTLAGIALAAIMLGAGSLVVTRKTR